MDGTLVEMGSAGAKVAAVVQGFADVYVHAGGRYSGTRRPRWPSHGPRACTPPASTARRCATNQSSPKLPDLVVCRPEYAEAVLAVTR